jgi:hypothetical protein
MAYWFQIFIRCHVQKTLLRTTSWTRLIQYIPYLFKVSFNIILPSTPMSSKWYPCFRFQDYNGVFSSYFTYSCYTHHKLHSSPFFRYNSTDRRYMLWNFHEEFLFCITDHQRRDLQLRSQNNQFTGDIFTPKNSLDLLKLEAQLPANISARPKI